MHEGSTVQSVIELHDAFLSTMAPFDSIVARFFRERRYIGSSDRRTIANMAYDILRSYAKILYINERITENQARFIVITYLIMNKQYDQNKMASIFNGKKYAPDRLSVFEKKWCDTVKTKNVLMPQHAILNYPAWLDDRLHKAFPENFSDELQELNKEAYVDVRVNTLKSNVEHVLTVMRKNNIEAEKSSISPVGIRIKSHRLSHSDELLSKGYIEIQDEGSQLIAFECNAKPGDTVIDMCAGAGGKTLAIAALMSNKGRIYATDVSDIRLRRAMLRLRKAGVCNVHCCVLTGKWIKRHLECADVVLVDAPCSGSGTWRRNPDMKYRLTENMLDELAAKQKEILDNAKQLVKAGGRLVYATCSVFQEENEDVISHFLANNKNFIIEPQTTLASCDKYLKMSPYKTGTDGFFCAKLKRAS